MSARATQVKVSGKHSGRCFGKQILLSFAFLATLAGCGSSKHGGEPKFPGPSVSEEEVIKDKADLAAAEDALAQTGIKFKIAEPHDKCVAGKKTCKWTLDMVAARDFAAKPREVRSAAVPLLQAYIARAQAYLEKYSRPLGVRMKGGAVPPLEIDEAALKDIKEKAELAAFTENTLSEQEAVKPKDIKPDGVVSEGESTQQAPASAASPQS